MDKATYTQVALEEEPSPTGYHTSPTTDVGSTPTSPSNRGSIQFAKAAFVFRDRLDMIRDKHTSIVGKPVEVLPTPHDEPPMSPPPTAATLVEKAPEDKDPVIAKRLRILRLVQNTATSALSIAIAVLQAKAYLSWEKTQNGNTRNALLVPSAESQKVNWH